MTKITSELPKKHEKNPQKSPSLRFEHGLKLKKGAPISQFVGLFIHLLPDSEENMHSE